jgi:FAD/FMN-containing dehydrogenase
MHDVTNLAARLGDSISGRVITPADAGYDQARTVFYPFYDRRPGVIVRPSDAVDVSKTVLAAAETGLELAVRSGGHSVPGHSTTEGGILLDLTSMTRLDIDVVGRTAWAETGMTAGQYTVQTAAHGLATGFGDTGSVGIGGLTLGGGIGYLVRKHGLTIDNLLAADVVTADGSQVRADETNHPDLFWAIRGGGGNFGVATRFQFRLHEVDNIVGGMLILPATPEVITRLIVEADSAPEELSIIANNMKAPPMPGLPDEHVGQPVIMLLLAYAGPLDAGEKAVARFRSLASPIADMTGPMPYPDLYRFTEEVPEIKHETTRSLFADDVDLAGAEAIVDHLHRTTAPLAVAQLRVLGGAFARVPNDATAFAHRHRRIMVATGVVYDDANEGDLHREWVHQLTDALTRGEPGVYANFLGDEGDRVRDAYPRATWDRLSAIKTRYDPDNLFRLNQNVPPES